MEKFEPVISETIDHIIASSGLLKPEIALAIAFLLSIISSLFFEKKFKNSTFLIAVLGFISAFILLIPQFNDPQEGFFGMIRRDDFSIYGRMLILFASLVTGFFIQQHFKHKAIKRKIADVYSILLAASFGLSLLTITTNWLLVFISIETVSIASYVLVGYLSENKKQSEAAVKYVLFGSACAAMMLYGLSLLYGFTGNLDFTSAMHIQGLISAPKILCSVAILFLFAGIGFKLSFAPFHVWSPDVYEGAPTPITAFLSTVPKIAVMILFSRLCASWFETFFYFSELTFLLLVVIAIVTMVVGNFIALRQENMKRLMAYSSIGHTGFLLMAVLAFVQGNTDVLLFYMAVYVLMNLSAFLYIDYLESKIGDANIQSFMGLGKKLPFTFVGFSLIGISLIGLPPTAGFIGKFLIFSNVFELYSESSEFAYLLLLIVGAITTVVSLFYYLKIPLYAFLKENKSDSVIKETFTFQNCLAFLFCIAVVILGIFPSLLLSLLK
ncbi:NADH-quinone oxidoreductase subunit N [Sphingobacterium hungaricum]|uniref:NADH-quinone oxidoreductase subunit N n=1 Tax=Sphingobacterium hungaricum TaxID=2082723 RepID=A0A928YQ76_9SPHI|nr:NADH-quinone oxidoreductase subunit N [Sphingobacterium hungaricum]MBE8713669.1 NADH-quinone oxidoreductase subunit L [Sphingobacterium hungaricum]